MKMLSADTRKYAARPRHKAGTLALAIHLAGAGLTAAAITAPMLWSNPANAQGSAESQARQTFDIPAGPLSAVLNRFAEQTGLYLSGAGELTNNKNSGGLKGEYTVTEGLRQLLAGAGIKFRFSGENTVTLTGEGDGATTLPPVKVSAETLQSRTGTAAEGYRALNSGIAGFSQRPIKDTPFSVKVVPAELMLNYGANEIDQLDNYDAAVSSATATTGWYSAPLIRGFSLHNWSNYRYNGLTIVNQQAVGLENKERVEVLKGLSALQGGFSTPGGLINYVTKRPQEITALHTYATEDGNVRAHADVGRMLTENFGVRINMSGENERSYVDKVDGTRYFVSLAADWYLTPATLLTFDIEHERRNQQSTPALQLDSTGELPDVDPTTFLGQRWSRYPTENTIVSATLEHQLSDNWSVSGNFNYAFLDRDQNNIYLRNIQPNGEADVFNYFSPNQNREPLNANLSINGTFRTANIHHDLTVGYIHSRLKGRWGDAFFGKIGTTNIHDPVEIAQPNLSDNTYPAVRWREHGVFINDIISFDDRWDFHLGGRYADIDRRFFASDGSSYGEYKDSTFTPSVALVFKPDDNLSLYMSYIEGLEQGGTAPAGTTNADQQMSPLISEQIEAGVKGESGSLAWEASVFQLSRPAEYTNSANTYVQDGEQLHQGVELSLSGKITPEFTLFGSVMLLDAELDETGDAVTEGKRPAGVPKHRVALTVEYSPHSFRGWVYSANWNHSGDQAVNASNTALADDYDIVSVGARHQRIIAGKKVTLRVNIDNISDERYWGSVGNNYLVPGAPRTVKGSISVNF